MASRSQGSPGDYPRGTQVQELAVFLRATIPRAWRVTLDISQQPFALWDMGQGSLVFLRGWWGTLMEALSGPEVGFSGHTQPAWKQ